MRANHCFATRHGERVARTAPLDVNARSGPRRGDIDASLEGDGSRREAPPTQPKGGAQ